MKNKKFIILIAVALILMMFAACAKNNSDDSEQITLIDIHVNDCDGIDQKISSEIKTAYCKFTCDKNYGGEPRFAPSDMYILRYEGKIGDCHIVMMGGDEIDYTQALRGVDVAGYRLVFGNGQPVYAYNNGNFYTIGEAYDAGLLSRENVYQIGSIFDPEFISRNSGEQPADTEIGIESITDNSSGLAVSDVEERIYEDYSHIYVFGNPRSQYVIVKYTDGTEENVKEALGSGRIKITDLDRYGISYFAEPKLIESIIDISQRDQLDTSDALEFFYRDDTYNYSFSSIKSHYIIVRYKDGTEQNVKDALEAGKIKISDLDWFGIKYYKEPLENFHE